MDSSQYQRVRRKIAASKAAILALVALIAVAGFGIALAQITVPVSLVDGLWSNARSNGGNTPSCLRYGYGTGATSYRGTAGTNGIDSQNTPNTDRNEVRYGIPTGYSNCPNDNTGYRAQSGYGFDGQAPATFNITVGQPFLLGQFTHFNWPINASTPFQKVDLTLKTTIAGVNADFLFTLEHDETSNNANPCPYLPGDPINVNGCADRVKFPATVPNQTITINGVQYTLQILGFVPGTAGTCTYDENSTVDYFITKEKAQNDACLFAKLIPPNQVDLKLEKDGPANAVPGSNIVYTVKVQNLGVVAANPVVVSDTLNVNFQYVSASGATCAATPPTNPNYTTPQTLSCTLAGGALPFTGNPTNDSRSFQVTVKVNPNIGKVAIENTACIDTTATSPADINPNNNCDTTTTTTPVTLSYFQANREGDGVRFTWATSSETDNLGFNLYAETEQGWKKLNDQIILSAAVDSFEVQEYSYTAANVDGDVFYIEDIDRIGRSLINGPILSGITYGAPEAREAIDWGPIQAEHAAKAEARDAALKAATAQLVSELISPDAVAAAIASQEPLVEQYSAMTVDPAEVLDQPLFLPLVTGPTLDSSPRVSAAALPLVELLVEEDGVYRVTFEALQAAGYNLAGVPCSDLALTRRGKATPIRAICRTTWGPGGYFEFYGKALDTLYSGTSVYRIEVNKALAQRINLNSVKPARSAVAPAYHMATATYERNNRFSRFSPVADPWYDVEMRATSAATWAFNLELTDAMPSVGPAYLSVDLWGGFDHPDINPDHHVIVKFNGAEVADVRFDGGIGQALYLELPPNVIRNGENTLELTLPVDTGFSTDLVDFNKFSLTYPRSFVAQGGVYEFTAAGDIFTVSNLPSKDVIVYRVMGDVSLVRLTQVKVEADGGAFKATFAGAGASNEAATYYVFAAAVPQAPAFRSARQPADITSGQAEYLVIAHPDFIGAKLDELVNYHAQNVSVKVVDLLDIYSQYAGGELDATAVRSYLMDAAANMGVKDVLLVGADTYNYRGYLPTGGVSFLPTMYAATDVLVRFAPADPLLADLNADGVQDLGLGRLPVRTTADLATVIDKILAYANRSYSGQAVLSADAGFKGDSLGIEAKLPAGWTVSKAYVDDLGTIAATKSALVSAMNGENDLISFVGHSSAATWSNQNLFNLNDAAAMTNIGKPTVVTQWGCWNTFFVDPYYNTMGHKFLLTGNQGASAVLGASTLTKSSSERALSQLLMPKLLQPGMTMGQAIAAAKQELAGQPNNYKDVLLSWTLLGDPRTVIVP